MRFVESGIDGAFLIHPEPIEDERGLFARTFCQREFSAHGLPSTFVQCSTSYNRRAGILRGMHFQLPPAEEGKLVRCSRGSIYDVILDLRRGSDTFLAWKGYELSADNRMQLYIPEGLAHGFLTLEDDTEVYYEMTAFHEPSAASGVRWNDPAFGITWPTDMPTLSSQDAAFDDFKP